MSYRIPSYFAGIAAFVIASAPATAQIPTFNDANVTNNIDSVTDVELAAQNTSNSNVTDVELISQERRQATHLPNNINAKLQDILTANQWQQYQSALAQGKRPWKALRELDLSRQQKRAVRSLREEFRQQQQNQNQESDSDVANQVDQEDNNNNQPVVANSDPWLNLLQIAVQQAPVFLNEEQNKTYQQVAPWVQLGINALANSNLVNQEQFQWQPMVEFGLQQAPNFLNEGQNQTYQQVAPLVQLSLDSLVNN